ncbi:MAG: hypothetical protein ACE5DZ_04705 [Mariprofundus sp.]
MPQFDSTFFASEIFWTIISFVVLYVLLSRWVLPRIASTLQQRTQLIKDEIDRAHQTRQQAECLKKEYAARLAAIEQDAKKMFDASEKRILERRNQLMAEWKNEMERKKLAFLEDAEVTRQQAIRDIRSQSADLIAAAAGKLIHQKINKTEAQKILEEAIESLEKSGPKKRTVKGG